MTGDALRIAWLNSRAANSALIVLLAITFETEENGRCVMNIAELATKARLSENAARIAVRDLEQLGEVSIASRRPGRGGGCTYMVTAEWARNPTGSGGLRVQTPQNLEGFAEPEQRKRRPADQTLQNLEGLQSRTILVVL